MQKSGSVTVEDRSGVRVVKMDRAPVNALDLDMLDTLAANLNEAGESDAKALIITGAHHTFSAGLDTRLISAADGSDRAMLRARLDALIGAAAHCAIPVAAAIPGHAIGVAAIVVALCDYRVAADRDAVIGLPEVKAGIPLSPCIHHIIARVVGARWADRLCVEGLLLSVREASDIGFLDEVVPAAEVLTACLAWIHGLDALPRGALLEVRANARADLHALVAGTE